MSSKKKSADGADTSTADFSSTTVIKTMHPRLVWAVSFAAATSALAGKGLA